MAEPVLLISSDPFLGGSLEAVARGRLQAARLDPSRRPVVWPGGPAAGTVVLDVTARQRAVLYAWVRRHHPGPMVMLLKPGERAPSLPADPAQVVIGRPFRLGDLVAVLEDPPVPGPGAPEPGPPLPGSPAPPGAPEPDPPDSGALHGRVAQPGTARRRLSTAPQAGAEADRLGPGRDPLLRGGRFDLDGLQDAATQARGVLAGLAAARERLAGVRGGPLAPGVDGTRRWALDQVAAATARAAPVAATLDALPAAAGADRPRSYLLVLTAPPGPRAGPGPTAWSPSTPWPRPGPAATCGRTPPIRPRNGCWPATASPLTRAVDSPRSVFATVDRNDRSPLPQKVIVC